MPEFTQFLYGLDDGKSAKRQRRRSGSHRRLRDSIVSMLEAIGAPIREIELVPWVTVIEAGANSRDDVVTLASLVASRCAEMRLTIPQVQTENPDSLTLNFGAVLLRITNTGGQGVSEGPPSHEDAKVLVTREAERVFADAQKAARWLRQPSRALGGRTPWEMLDSESGAGEVVEELGRIDHGILS